MRPVRACPLASRAREMSQTNHIDHEVLDSYSLGRLEKDKIAGVEEHLLTCELCQEELTVTDEFIAALRRAAKDQSQS